jgi:hypothetical protein
VSAHDQPVARSDALGLRRPTTVVAVLGVAAASASVAWLWLLAAAGAAYSLAASP